MAYTGTSIVDYLKSVGQDSSYDYRKTLASQYGISGYTGTASQNTQLLKTLQGGTSGSVTPTNTNPVLTQGSTFYNPQTGAALLPAQAPTTASGVNTGVSSVNMPTNTPSLGNTSGAVASSTGMNSYLDTLMKQNADFLAQQQSSIASQQKESSSFLEKLLNTTKSPMDARNAAWNDTGVTPKNYFAEEKMKIEEINTLTQEYNATKAQMEAQIAQSNDKLASNNFINNQIAQIQRNAAPKLNMISANINSKAATLQALQGRFNEAQNFVNQAVQDATADFKYKMDVFSTFYTVNQDSIARLDSAYQDAFKTSMSLATVAYEQQYKEKTLIGEMMMDNPKAGITMTDSFATAAQKVARAGGSLSYQQEQRLGSSGSTVTSTASTDVQTYAQAYLDGQIEITSVPQSQRASVLAEANRLAEAALAGANTTTTSSGTPKISQPYSPIAQPTINPTAGTGVINLAPTIKSVASNVKTFFSNLFGN